MVQGKIHAKFDRIHPVVWEENGDKQTNRQTNRHTFLFYMYT